MDLLFITPCFPDPNGLGAERRAWSHLSTLAEHGAVHVVATLAPGLMANAIERLQPAAGLAARTCALACETSAHGAGSLSGLARSLFDNRTNRERLLIDAGEGSTLTGWPRNYDRIFGFRLSSHAAWEQLSQAFSWHTTRVVIDFDDIESLARRRALVHLSQRLGRLRALQERLDIRHTARLEDRVLDQADDVLVCSELDRQALHRRRARGARISVLPNTVDVDAGSRLAPPTTVDDNSLLFLGAMNYPPNMDGAGYLVRDILPLLNHRLGRAVQLFIVGYKPQPQVEALAAVDGVTVTGAVPDTEPYYQRTSVSLVPLRFGGGTRIKILESMARGRPVVSTRLGAEGLDVTDGLDILLADTPEAFADAVARLLDDRALWQRLVDNGQQLVRTRYSRAAASTAMARLIEPPAPQSPNIPPADNSPGQKP